MDRTHFRAGSRLQPTPPLVAVDALAAGRTGSRPDRKRIPLCACERPNVARNSSPESEWSIAHESSDARLILAVARADRAAFEMLYDRYAPTVFGLVLTMLSGEHELAEEALQEIFWRVWKRANSFDPRHNAALWLIGIAHAYCLDQVRLRPVRLQCATGDEQARALTALAQDAPVSRVGVADQYRPAVVAAVRKLVPDQRRALQLAYFSGMTVKEIADRLRTCPGSGKTMLLLGLRKLRQIFHDS